MPARTREGADGQTLRPERGITARHRHPEVRSHHERPEPVDAMYVRRQAAVPASAQQQAAEAWATAGHLGHHVVEVGGARLDDEPPHC